MSATLAHRGPDGQGQWADEPTGIAFGHRRLAIVDLSDAGAQPMRSPDRRFVFMVNGELYNHSELRDELIRQGAEFAGHCDSEVMLQAVVEWGLERALERFNGMFAFALWDARERVLHLVRDRIGEKPLYYGQWDGSFVFASEIKALRAHPAFRPELDVDAVARFFRYGYIGGARSIYRNVRKLPPGTRIAVRPADAGIWPEPRAYWSLGALVREAGQEPFGGSGEEAASRLSDLLEASVGLRRRADVPVGALLSGGVDSSTLAALLSLAASGPVKTFSIGMREATLDEAPAARAVARHLGCEHTELYLEDTHALRIVQRLSDVFDEPFADPSAIPTLLVSGLAKTSVKAVLSGDGADELLGGYERHRVANRLHARTRAIPGPIRRAAGSLLSAFGNERLRAAGNWLKEDYPESIYRHLVSHWKDPGPLVGPPRDAWSAAEPGRGLRVASEFDLHVRHMDAVNLLPGDYLVKMDRASMAEGLEVRLPFLDPDVVKFCLRLPPRFRHRSGVPKWVLRQVLRRHVPEPLMPRKKKGFAVPLGRWLRGPLREWSENLLSEASLARSEVLDVELIRANWRAHCSGRIDLNRRLWNVLMFQSWMQVQGNR